MHPDAQFPHDEWAEEKPEQPETQQQFEQRLYDAAHASITFLAGKVKNAAEMKTAQLMALANTISMGDSPTEDTLNGIELLLELVKHFKGVREQLHLVGQFEAALNEGPKNDIEPLTNTGG